MKTEKLVKLSASCAFFFVIGGGAVAQPLVSDVSISQRGASRLVQIDYRLTGEKAIVTVDIQTNGVSIGAANFANAVGDVNREIEPSDERRTITWSPKDSWPNQVVAEQALTAVVIAHTYDDPPDYMVVDLSVKDTVRYYDCAEQVPGGVTNDAYKTEKLLFRKIPAAGVEWRMGSPSDGILAEVGRGTDEAARLVKLSRDYYMAVYELTYRQFNVICDSSYGADADMKTPFSPPYGSCRGTKWPEGGHTNVSGVVRNLRAKASGFMFDLPTEAQWEFACRGGSGTAFCNGGNLSDANAETDESADRYAVYKGNATTNDSGKQQVSEVGTKAANTWGLYDMQGNMNEWCLDWYAADVSALPTLDPEGPSTAVATGEGGVSRRVYRGGAYSSKPVDLRAAKRASRDQWADYGGVCIRLCCPVPMTVED